MLLHTHFTSTSRTPFQFSKTHPPSLFLSFCARFQLFHTFYSTGSGLLSGPQLSGSELRISSRAFDLVYSQH